MPAHPYRRPGLRRDALLPGYRRATRPPTLRRPHRTHQRTRLDPGHKLNSYATSPVRRTGDGPNLTKHSITELTALVKTRLKRMQYRPALLAGFLTSTGLEFGPFL